MDRDEQIAKLIRTEVAKVSADKKRLNYRVGSPEDALLVGKITGLRQALAFVDPNPWQ